MNTGTLGVHFIGSSANCSRDMAIARVKQLRGKFTVSVNDAQFCKMVQDVGGVPIHRVFAPEQGWNDDAAPFDHFTGKAYIEHLHSELAAWGVTNALYYLGNEVGNTNMPKLMAWALDGLHTAEAFGAKVVALNIAWRNWSMADWDALAPLLNAVRDGGHYIGVHEGLSPEFPTVKEAYPEAVGRFVAMQQKYGVQIIVTEFAYSVSADKGWIPGGLSGQEYASRSRDCVAQVYAPHGAGVCFFTGCVWDRGVGFETLFDDDLNTDFAAINVMYPLKDVPIVVQPITPDRTTLGAPLDAVITHTAADVVNVRADVTTTSAVLATLKTGDAIQVRPTLTVKINGYQWNAIEHPVVGWAANVFTWSAAPPTETWTVNLAVPYVSQLGTDAALSNNDCLISSLLMLERYWFTQRNGLTPSLPTVDELTKHTRLAQANPPKGLTFSDGIALAKQTGFRLDLVATDILTLKSTLDQGKPVLALLDYQAFNPTANEEFAHFAVIKGYNADAFLCADPYKAGDNYRVSQSQLDRAMKSVVGNSGSYQGAMLG